jgi:hypothetical protein
MCGTDLKIDEEKFGIMMRNIEKLGLSSLDLALSILNGLLAERGIPREHIREILTVKASLTEFHMKKSDK